MQPALLVLPVLLMLAGCDAHPVEQRIELVGVDGESSEGYAVVSLWDSESTLELQKNGNTWLAIESVVKILGTVAGEACIDRLKVNGAFVDVDSNGGFVVYEAVKGAAAIELEFYCGEQPSSTSWVDILGPEFDTPKELFVELPQIVAAGSFFVPSCSGYFVDDLVLPLESDSVTLTVEGPVVVGAEPYVWNIVGPGVITVTCTNDSQTVVEEVEVGPGLPVLAVATTEAGATSTTIVAGEELALRCEGFDAWERSSSGLDFFRWHATPAHRAEFSESGVSFERAGEYEVACEFGLGEESEPLSILVVPAEEHSLDARMLVAPSTAFVGDLVEVESWWIDQFGNKVRGGAADTVYSFGEPGLAVEGALISGDSPEFGSFMPGSQGDHWVGLPLDRLDPDAQRLPQRVEFFLPRAGIVRCLRDGVRQDMRTNVDPDFANRMIVDAARSIEILGVQTRGPAGDTVEHDWEGANQLMVDRATPSGPPSVRWTIRQAFMNPSPGWYLTTVTWRFVGDELRRENTCMVELVGDTTPGSVSRAFHPSFFHGMGAADPSSSAYDSFSDAANIALEDEACLSEIAEGWANDDYSTCPDRRASWVTAWDRESNGEVVTRPYLLSSASLLQLQVLDVPYQLTNSAGQPQRGCSVEFGQCCGNQSFAPQEFLLNVERRIGYSAPPTSLVDLEAGDRRASVGAASWMSIDTVRRPFRQRLRGRRSDNVREFVARDVRLAWFDRDVALRGLYDGSPAGRDGCDTASFDRRLPSVGSISFNGANDGYHEYGGLVKGQLLSMPPRGRAAARADLYEHLTTRVRALMTDARRAFINEPQIPSFLESSSWLDGNTPNSESNALERIDVDSSSTRSQMVGDYRGSAYTVSTSRPLDATPSTVAVSHRVVATDEISITSAPVAGDADGYIAATFETLARDLESLFNAETIGVSPQLFSLSEPSFELPSGVLAMPGTLTVNVRDCIADVESQGGPTLEIVPDSIDEVRLVLPKCTMDVRRGQQSTMLQVAFEQRFRLSAVRDSAPSLYRWATEGLALVATAEPIGGTERIVLSPNDHVTLGMILNDVGYSDVYGLADGCVAVETCTDFSLDAATFSRDIEARLSVVVARALNHVLERVRLDEIVPPENMYNARVPDLVYVWLTTRFAPSLYVENGNVVLQGRLGPNAIECQANSDCACATETNEFCYGPSMTCTQGLCR